MKSTDHRSTRPTETTDLLTRRLIADADAWRRSMPGPIELANPAERPDAAGASALRWPPRRWSAPLRWSAPVALAAMVLLGLVIVVWQRPAESPGTATPSPDTVAVSRQLDSLMAVDAGSLDQPLRSEARVLVEDARQAADFLVARISVPMDPPTGTKPVTQ